MIWYKKWKKKNITPRDTGVLPVLDPDLAMGGGGGGGGLQKNIFFPLGLSLV